jgi:sugar lactone lactonase YvrE
MMAEMRVEQVTGPITDHGEGPVWSERWGGLRWLDMLAGEVLSLGADGAVTRRRVGTVAAAVRPRRGGGAVLGVDRGFALEDAEGGLTHLDELWTDGWVRMNEGACDPDGRFYCGSMASRVPRAGALYRLDPDLSVSVVLEGVTVSNGLDWSPDGSLVYYADTETGLDVFGYERDDGLTGRRRFAETGSLRPDGLTVDAEGGIWVALSNGGAVRRYAPDGTLDQVVELPVTKVTACTFGGPALDQLFVTTSRRGRPRWRERAAGSLFRVDVGVTGQPVREFAG